MQNFSLDPRLENDSVWVADHEHCTIRLINDARYVWVVLIPTQKDSVELHDLPADIFTEIMALTRTIGQRLHAHYNATKINTAAIGNIVAQLHIHIVVRHDGDPAWPAPVWGHSPAETMRAESCADRVETIRKIIAG